MTKIDDNRGYSALAYDGTNTVPLKVDPDTGRLLLELNYLPAPSSTLNDYDIDENNKIVDEVVDDNGVIRPLLIDSRNGYLLIDLAEE